MNEPQRSPVRRLVSRLGGRAIAGLALGAILVPLLAVTAVAGLEGSDTTQAGAIQLQAVDDTGTATSTPTPLSAAMAAREDGNGCDDELFADGMHTPTPGGPSECTVGNSGDNRKNGQQFATGTPTPTVDPSASPSPTASATASASATATGPHSNGKGCDDVLFKDGARPPVKGGPADCTVGNSADHRQNGKKDGTATATPSTTATATGTGTAAASPTSTSTAASGPHADGNGCDDVNERQPGGPQGCEVGNSGEHRRNGANNSSTTTPAPSPSGTAAAGTATGSNGPGNSGNAGNKNK